jgi:hypothetical protein
MTRRQPMLDAPRDVCPHETQTQFLLARKQTAAHGSTARYREMRRWPAPAASPQTSSRGTT